jgi:hypothetical protein
MFTLVCALVPTSAAFLCPATNRALEAVAFRQQLTVFKLNQTRPKLRTVDVPMSSERGTVIMCKGTM